MLQENLLMILVIFGRISTKKQPQLTKNKENRQNPNRSMKFSEIWDVDALQQQKILKLLFFWISAFFGRFLTKTQPKLIKNVENWQNSNRLMKFSEIWYLDVSQ